MDISVSGISAIRPAGNISEANALQAAELALAKIYDIQNNQHLLNMIKLKHELG